MARLAQTAEEDEAALATTIVAAHLSRRPAAAHAARVQLDASNDAALAARTAEILALPEAAGRQALARHLAETTDIPVLQVARALGAAAVDDEEVLAGLVLAAYHATPRAHYAARRRRPAR